MYNVVLVPGNGPQVGLLALQGLEYKKVNPYPLDVLGSETQGMIGYMLMQEFKNYLPDRNISCMLTQMTVDQTILPLRILKPIGPICRKTEARELAKTLDRKPAANSCRVVLNP